MRPLWRDNINSQVGRMMRNSTVKPGADSGKIASWLGSGSAHWGGAIWALMLAFAVCLSAAAPASATIRKVDVRQEIECLALTIYFEARGEPDEGKIAVGHVVMNRASNPLFPSEVCQVVQQSSEKYPLLCQFSWWCDGRSDQPRDSQSWEKSKAFARLVYWHYSLDPTNGALWYHAEYVKPKWRRNLARGPKIGQHIFYKMVSGWGKEQKASRHPVSYSLD